MFGSSGGGSYRCSVDGISFPPSYGKFGTCPVCGERTSYFNDVEPDEDWEWKATLLQEQLKTAEESAIDLGALGIKSVPTTVKVKFEHGYWIHYWDLYHAGVRDKLAEGELIRVGEQVFEVLEYVETLRSFAVRPFSFELSEEELMQLSGQDG